MPVSLLLCEGEANSPDVRVLTKLLAGRCAVRPSGGKYGMGDRVKARREAIGRETVFGLLDGDFISDFQVPTGQPSQWIGSDGTHLGWRWTQGNRKLFDRPRRCPAGFAGRFSSFARLCGSSRYCSGHHRSLSSGADCLDSSPASSLFTSA